MMKYKTKYDKRKENVSFGNKKVKSIDLHLMVRSHSSPHPHTLFFFLFLKSAHSLSLYLSLSHTHTHTISCTFQPLFHFFLSVLQSLMAAPHLISSSSRLHFNQWVGDFVFWASLFLVGLELDTLPPEQ